MAKKKTKETAVAIVEPIEPEQEKRSDDRDAYYAYWRSRMRSVGRPPVFVSPQAFMEDCLDYLDTCDALKQVPTKAGLCVWLNVTRTTLFKYEHENGEEYNNAIKRVYKQIEDRWLQQLPRMHPAGTIFYLKNAFKENYRDTYDMDHTTKGKEINFTISREIAEKHKLVFMDPKSEPEPIAPVENNQSQNAQ